MKDPYLHIEEYIAGTLSSSDKAAFELAMKSDEQLRAAVEDFDLVHLVGDALLEEEIAKIVSEETTSAAPTDQPSIIKRLQPWLAAAAVIVGLFWINNTFLNNEDSQALQQRYIAAFDHYDPPHATVRGDDSPSKTTLEKIQQAFDKKQYAEAERLLDNIEISSDGPQIDQINWYKAHIAYRQQQFAKSLKLMDSIEDSTELYKDAIRLRTLIYYVTSEYELYTKICKEHSHLHTMCESLNN